MSIPELLKIIENLPSVMHLEFDGVHYQKTYQHTFLPPQEKNRIVLELMALCVPLAIQDDELAPLFQFANGISLFHSESENDDTGELFIPPVDFFPLERLAAETAYMQSRAFEAVDNGDDPQVYANALAIGEATGAGGPFAVIRWGHIAGQVFYVDHDPDTNDWLNNPFANSLTDLLRQIALPPHAALCHLCGADRIWF